MSCILGLQRCTAVPLRTHKATQGFSQREQQRGYSLSPQGHPLSPQVQLVLEVLEGPSIEKREKNPSKPLKENVLLFVTFVQQAGKELELSVYFCTRKINPEALCTHAWHMEAIERGKGCVPSPPRASRTPELRASFGARCKVPLTAGPSGPGGPSTSIP